MKILIHALLFSFLALGVTSCEADDDMMEEEEPPVTMTPACEQEVTFVIGTDTLCMTGTFALSTISTTLNLQGENGERMVIGVLGTTTSTFAIPQGNATYTDAGGTIYASDGTGTITITENDPTLDATFEFGAAVSGGASIMIESGAAVDLPSS